MTQINSLITAYQTEGCEASFNALYAHYSDKLANVTRKQARLRGLPYDEAESEANMAFYQAVATYDVNIGEFDGFLFTRLRQKLATLKRKQETYQKYTDQLAVEAATSAPNEPELSAIKKEQRQLLRKLYVEASAKSRQALDAYASTDCNSFREAGKLLGVKHETVKNRIEKISAGRQNISLNDYITA